MFADGGIDKLQGTLTVHPTAVNGNPAPWLRLDGEIDGVIALRVEDTHITGLYYVRDPEDRPMSRPPPRSLFTDHRC
ncbi:hypothetical protein [Lentzea albidocapillata]|uniref:RNA polymerase sigma-70 factor, ECF subfamily n=1 Tax=Lentzea albidocapillata TaxID=40571 RepID=A0A1W2FS04_9PSEU|nr:hypothetical protein [Lentzea albidocapillata]SMD24749.1 RNA polymerase sigma-70 factor, ECF subfamily [Lentzea albidocapillata]